MDIFRDEQDYKNFIKRLRICLGMESQGAPLRLTPFSENDFSLIAFCLMPNHFHLQIMQNTDIPVGKLLLKICTSYSMYFNRKYDHVGHVFQDQFKAIPTENDNQLMALSAYIHQNPKVAALVEDLKDWPYSSYPEYVSAQSQGFCKKEKLLGLFRTPREYESFVEEQYERILARKEYKGAP